MKSNWNTKMIAFAFVCSFVAGMLSGVACVQVLAKSKSEINISGEVFTKK